MLNKINVKSIVQDHVRTLHITGSKKVHVWDIVLFYVFPTAVMLASLLGLGLRVSESLANALFTGVSIFAGLLFNVQILIYDNIRHVKTTDEELPAVTRYRRFLFNELFSNVSYAIFVCLVMMVLIGLFNLTFEGGWLESVRHQIEGWLDPIALTVQFLVLTVALHFILTMFMVLKRVHLLLKNEMKQSTN